MTNKQLKRLMLAMVVSLLLTPTTALANQPPWWVAYTNPGQMGNTLPAWFNNWQEYQAWMAHWWNGEQPTTLNQFATGNWWNNLPIGSPNWGQPWGTPMGWPSPTPWDFPGWWSHPGDMGWNQPWNNPWQTGWNNNWQNQDWINDGYWYQWQQVGPWQWMEPINVNTASSSLLRELPGVTAAIATRIIHARPFDDIEELRDIQGITNNIFNQIRPLVTW